MGNNRISFYSNSGTASLLQEDEYYSFGLRKPLYDNSNNNRYLYNGKEVQTDLKDQYDYGARFYDPVIGRWTSVDPKAITFPDWSPYVYVFDNPVSLIDPDGMSGKDPRWSFYKTIGNSAINAAGSAGANNQFKGLYMIAQRRVENGFNKNPPGNSMIYLEEWLRKPKETATAYMQRVTGSNPVAPTLKSPSEMI